MDIQSGILGFGRSVAKNMYFFPSQMHILRCHSGGVFLALHILNDVLSAPLDAPTF